MSNTLSLHDALPICKGNRMKRRLIGLLTLLSLLMALAIAGLWIRGGVIADPQWKLVWHDSFVWRAPARYVEIVSVDGVLGALVTFDGDECRNGFSHEAHQLRTGTYRLTSLPSFNEQGFGLSWEKTVEGGWKFGARRLLILYVPCWLPLALTAAGPAWRLARIIRRSRRKQIGVCATCSYDLRATPDRCPECGDVPRDHAKMTSVSS